MKVLMLGWEYPPHISGGLGTACQGLTTSLAKRGIDIDFVVPHLFGDEKASHMHLLDSYSVGQAAAGPCGPTGLTSVLPTLARRFETENRRAASGEVIQSVQSVWWEQILKTRVDSLLTPYATPSSYLSALVRLSGQKFLAEQINDGEPEKYPESVPENIIEEVLHDVLPQEVLQTLAESGSPHGQGGHYGSDLFTEVDRFTKNLLTVVQTHTFDLIHAHDWMTYPAGIALSRLTGKPLVVHVHSLEYDRSGTHHNERIHRIEHAGVSEATKVIAVSYYTRSIVNREHGVALDKIAVVHNGVYAKETVRSYEAETPKKSKIVLFLGRITFQKGPDYFVEAAARVLTLIPDVKFVMAGSGDMLPALISRVAELGISQNFIFTGFLKGQDVERIFAIADLYVMPSVSEPFGIAPLEAMSQDVPVIISRQSGVAEVLNSALKVDFWDVEKMANMIVSVLKYPEIRADALSTAREEIGRLHWDAAAEKTEVIYRQALKQSMQQALEGV